MNTSDKASYGYTLKHWSLVYLGDKVAASGNLHDRPGYPNGVEIRSSVINSWELRDDTVFLFTENSIYRCSPKEHVLSGESLSLLNQVFCRSGNSVEDLNDIIWSVTETEVLQRRRALTSILSEKSTDEMPDSCVLFRWEGCDLPYLKQVVHYEKGQIRIDDLPHARQAYRSGIALSEFTSLNVSTSNEKSRYFYFFSDEQHPILVENTGDQTVYVNVRNRKSISVNAGTIVCIS